MGRVALSRATRAVAHRQYTLEIVTEYHLAMFDERMISISSILAVAPKSRVSTAKTPHHCDRNSTHSVHRARPQSQFANKHSTINIHVLQSISKFRENCTFLMTRSRSCQSYARIRRVQSDLSSKFLLHNSHNIQSYNDIITRDFK